MNEMVDKGKNQTEAIASEEIVENVVSTAERASDMADTVNDKYKIKQEFSEEAVPVEASSTANQIVESNDIEFQSNKKIGYIEELIEPASTQRNVDSDASDAASSFAQSVDDAKGSTIETEKNLKIIEENNIIEFIKTKKIAVVEPVFTEEIVENLESIQDIKEAVTGAASSLIKKIVDKIENKIEKNVQKEEWKGIIEDKDHNKMSVTDEPVFTEGSEC